MLRAGCNLGPTGKKSPSSSIYFVLVSPPSVAPLLHSVVIPPWGLLLFQNGHLRHGVRPSFCPSLGSNEGVWFFHSALPQGHVPPFAALPHPFALGAAFHSPSTAVQAPFEPKLQSLQRPWEVRTPAPPFPAPPRICFHALHFFPKFIWRARSSELQNPKKNTVPKSIRLLPAW